jgi:hypothetical protein
MRCDFHVVHCLAERRMCSVFLATKCRSSRVTLLVGENLCYDPRQWSNFIQRAARFPRTRIGRGNSVAVQHGAGVMHGSRDLEQEV